MDTVIVKDAIAHRLAHSGVLLLLLGLLTGLAVPKLANPRMGLASHVEGVMGGMLLALLSFLCSRLRLGAPAMKAASWLAVYGAYAKWANPLLASIWDAGGSMMPDASKGKKGTALQEAVISAVAVSMVLALLPAVCLILWGLRRSAS